MSKSLSLFFRTDALYEPHGGFYSTPLRTLLALPGELGLLNG
jgi:hypothetical protein